MASKERIKACFGAASTSYDQVADVQRESARFLVEMLRESDDMFYPRTILDLGTGTGYVVEALKKHYVDSFYTLNDLSPEMIKAVERKFIEEQNFFFCVGDMEKEEFGRYQLIISNLALQWTMNLYGVIEKCVSRSEILAFSCLLDGTFNEWNEILTSCGCVGMVKSYPKTSEIVGFCGSLSSRRLCCITRDVKIRFSDIRGFMMYLKALGANASDDFVSVGVLRRLIREYSGELEVSYKIFYAVLFK